MNNQHNLSQLSVYYCMYTRSNNSVSQPIQHRAVTVWGQYKCDAPRPRPTAAANRTGQSWPAASHQVIKRPARPGPAGGVPWQSAPIARVLWRYRRPTPQEETGVHCTQRTRLVGNTDGERLKKTGAVVAYERLRLALHQDMVHSHLASQCWDELNRHLVSKDLVQCYLHTMEEHWSSELCTDARILALEPISKTNERETYNANLKTWCWKTPVL